MVNRTTRRGAVENLLRHNIEVLGMLTAQDQRFGAKIFYSKPEFNDVVKKYLSSSLQLRDAWTQQNFDNLLTRASAFVEFVEDQFPGQRSRMLTALRENRTGSSFRTLFRETRALVQWLQMGFQSDGDRIEPIDLPEQKSSPIYTKIEDSRIVIDAGRALHPFLRKEAVAQTREYLQKELNELTKALRASNVDRKFVEAFEKLCLLISFQDDAGAISFGLHVRLMSQLAKGIESEISDVLSLRIASTLTHAGYFASQYKDWVEFLKNAKNYPPRRAIENEIDLALSNVTELLASKTETVDERIPAIIRLIATLLKGTKEDRANAIYAGVRGVENICVSAIKYAYDEAILYLQDSGKLARPALVKLGALSILGVALAVISKFMPVITGAPELNWITENLPQIQRIMQILQQH